VSNIVRKMANTTNKSRVQTWREKNAEANRLRNRNYSKKYYVWKIISAEFRKIDTNIFQ